MWKDHRICSVLLQRKESWTSGWEVSRGKKMQLNTRNTQQGSFSSVSLTVSLKTTLRADSHKRVRQMTFKALYSPQLELEDTTSLSVTDALAPFVTAKLTEPDLSSPIRRCGSVLVLFPCVYPSIFNFSLFLEDKQAKPSFASTPSIQKSPINYFSVFKPYIIQESKMSQESEVRHKRYSTVNYTRHNQKKLKGEKKK